MVLLLLAMSMQIDQILNLLELLQQIVVDYMNLKRLRLLGFLIPLAIYIKAQKICSAVPVNHSIRVCHRHHNNIILFSISNYKYLRNYISGVIVSSFASRPSATNELEVSEGCWRAVITMDFSASGLPVR